MDEYYYRDSSKSRAKRKAKQRKKAIRNRVICVILMLVVIAAAVFFLVKLFGSSDGESATGNAATAQVDSGDVVIKAKALAASYDYDGAIALIKESKGYESDSEKTALIKEFETARDACKVVDMKTVPHVFFHSLVVDPKTCFDTTKHNEKLVAGFNAWMVTVEEFNKTIEQLYKAGYVIINVSDCYTKDANGNYKPSTDVKLPDGKKALVFSYDDTCYYCSYDGWGCATKLIVDENGEVKNEYIDPSGNTLVGSYDHITILNDFCKEHPDFTYHGHKGTLALTGYDGILGYRTEPRMFTNSDVDEKKWLEKNTWCTLDQIETYKQQAKVVADAMKEDGYEFASHTWGHINCGTCGMSALQQDTGWWKERVESIVGPVEILIFPHGADFAKTEDYTMSNEKFAYLKGQGFSIFCGIDGTQLYWNQFRDSYIRQARIDIDGYFLYRNKMGESSLLSKLGLDSAAIFDAKSRPQPVYVP